MSNWDGDFRKWLVLAVVLRLVASATHASWSHPDEWYQTIELANLISRGFATHSQEISLHLRNLSWPVVLVLPLKLALWIDPDSVGLRLFLIQAFVSLLDLAMIWGWCQFLRPLPRAWKNFALAALIIPSFFLRDALRPSGEHLSTVMLWLALGLKVTGRPLGSGFFSIAIAAAKYPAGLMSLGIALSSALESRRTRDWSKLGRYLLGCLTGLVAFGLPDLIFYGRPWESLWMYSVFNFFSGASELLFGKQSLSVYGNWISYRWLQPWTAPALVVLLPASLVGLWQGWRAGSAWALAFGIYVLGHLWVGHREGRFLQPAESLWLWAAVLGLFLSKEKLAPHFNRWARLAVALLLIANSLALVREVWGETFRPNLTYLEISRHLRESQRVCAAPTARDLPSFLMPDNLPAGASVGRITEDRDSTRSQWRVHWSMKAPVCDPAEDQILIHTVKSDPGLIDLGCALLDSSWLQWVPRRIGEYLAANRKVSGPWYRCPASTLRKIQVQSPKVEPALDTSLERIRNFLESELRARA